MVPPGLQEGILCGHPVTISQCKFQAYIARVTTAEEARAVCKSVSEQTERATAFAEYKWDIRDRVLVVTRINGGFVKAELLGVRRYRFVVDRAKKLLEHSELASLRRAVDTDVNPPTTHESTTTLATNGEVVDIGRLCPTPRNSLQEVADAAAAVGDSWDRFVLPFSAQEVTAGEGVGSGSVLGAPPPPASGGAMNPWRTINSGSRGRGQQRGSVDAKQSPKAKGIEGSCWYDAGEKSRSRERQALSLAQLSISSKTVAFPPGHVPSVLGTRGHGKKRGRINHFAVRTPPLTSCGSVAGNGNGKSNRIGMVMGENNFGQHPNDDPDANVALQVCSTSAWILPHQLDPTSAITDLGASCVETGVATKGGRKTGGAGYRPSFVQTIECPPNSLLSRMSSCATINSPSRVSAIMLGMATGIAKDHTLHPPPPAAAAYANRYNLRKGKQVPGVLANNYNGEIDLSFASSSLGSFSRSDTSDEYLPIRDGLRRYHQQSSTSAAGYPPNHNGKNRVSPHPPPPIGPGEASANASGYGGTGAGGLLRDGDLLKNFRVRDEPYQNSGGVATEMLGSSASVGGWKNDDDRSISTTSGGGESLGLDEPSHYRRADAGGEETLADEGEGRQQQQCDSPPWILGEGTTGRTSAASGFSDVVGSRGESALRGWTAGRAVPASHHT
eukprot:jgi/Undpi1/5086/HiC_scaffold_19.g08438.m1